MDGKQQMTDLKCPTCKGTSEKGACPYCRKRLKKILNELISFIDLLNSNASLRQQVSTHQEGRGSLSSSLIINVQIVDLISKTGVQLVLDSWASMIVEERELNPKILNATKERSKLHAIHYVLDTHNDWLADTDMWHDYYEEVREPWTTLRRIIHGERKPAKRVPCPVQDCVGVLHLEPNGDVHCMQDDTHSWIYEQWSRLAKLLVEPVVQ
jgi:hypothetical protein